MNGHCQPVMQELGNDQPAIPVNKDVIVITGGAGFLGSHVVRAVHEAYSDAHIVALDRVWKDTRKTYFDAEYQDQNVHAEELDITDVDATQRIFSRLKNVIAVIHTAGVVPNASQHYDTSKREYQRCHAVNVMGARNVLDAALTAGARAFVYTSSVTVIIDDGSPNHRNMNESLPTGNATLPYAKTKTIAERSVLAANSDTFKTCALRPSVLFGPGDENCIPSLYSCIDRWETPFVIGDPVGTLYDFTYVTNVADAHVLALKNLLGSATAGGHTFFITNDQPVPFRSFCLAVWSGFGHLPPFELGIPVVLAWLLGLVMEILAWVFRTEATLSRGSVKELTMDAYCDISRAREALGYEPRIGLTEGIRLSCEDYMLRRRAKNVLSEDLIMTSVLAAKELRESIREANLAAQASGKSIPIECLRIFKQT